MSIITSEIRDLDSYTSALTSRIKADLPAWYSAQAQLIDAPTFHPRGWSYFFRYRVRVSESLTRAVLVKIRHTENMSITEARVHEKMMAEMQDEYASLVKIENTFANTEEAHQFFTIRPLALYEDLNVLVMEEAEIRPLKSYFQARAMWREGKARQTFETYMERSGRWLRIFHDQIGETKTDGPLLSEMWHQLTKERLARLATIWSHSTLHTTSHFLEEQFEKKKSAYIPYRTLHEDYNAANVFVTADGKICSFDPHNRPGPIFYDLAKILTDLEMSRTQMLSFGRSVPPAWLQKYQTALLRGYFKDEPFDESALDLFHMLTLIERWDEAETSSLQASGRKKLAYVLSAPQMRYYFASLLRRQLAD